jgi:enediyne biosynthesis protein E4
VTNQWGLGTPGFSNGAAYADLNNSGALDLIVNTIDAPAAIYRNLGRAITGNSSLTVALRGTGANTFGIGTKLFVWSGGRMQFVEQSPTRGFESSVDQRLHVGLGRDSVVDSVLVVWSDRSMQRLKHLPVNRLLTLSQGAATGRWALPPSPAPLFRDVTDARHVDARHIENDFVDFDREPLMPRMISTEGPALAVADVDGDGRDDVFLGGATFQAGALLVQQGDGSFRRTVQPALAADSIAEDIDATFFDANGDGHPDLYVASGGNQFEIPAAPMRGRLYLNDGHGLLTRSPDAIPELYDNGGCVAAGDFDGDGHIDLFVGSRSVPGRYGVSPKSHLLHNDGTGRFTDVTVQRAPTLSEAGMATSCAWVDYDGDGRRDLVVVGEWMPVRVFHNENGQLVERTSQVGLTGSDGWWNTVTVADVNGDGHPDLVLGNLGLNSTIAASRARPARLFVGRFAGDSNVIAIPTVAQADGDHVIAGRDELLRAIPSLRDRFPSYASFGGGAIDKVLSGEQIRSARTLQANSFASAIALNDGKRFRLEPLPIEAQLAPVNAVVADDFDHDGHLDLLLGGNFFGVPPAQGRYDASHGVLLRGDGHGRFVSMDVPHSGLEIDGQIRRMREVRTPNGPLVAVARNNDRLLLLQAAAPAPAPSPKAP